MKNLPILNYTDTKVNYKFYPADSGENHLLGQSPVVIFSYCLNTDRFRSIRPHSYISKRNRLVITGINVGFKLDSVGQFNYCAKDNTATMMAEKGNEDKALAYFLHRVLRMKKRYTLSEARLGGF
jgi:hypothetical protein